VFVWILINIKPSLQIDLSPLRQTLTELIQL